MGIKKCPLTKQSCMLSECGFYDVRNKQCSLLTIAESLDVLAKILAFKR